MVTKPLLMGLISAVVFGGILVGFKVFIYAKTGQFSRMDMIEIIVWIAVAFIWPFFFRMRK